MFIKCCNPECGAPFDYREGRLIRFSRNTPNDSSSYNRNTNNCQVIEHFWLCGKCAALYVFENEPGNHVTVRPRTEEFSQRTNPRSTLVAPTLVA